MSPRLSATDRDPAEVYEKEQREMLQESDAELLKVRATGNEGKKELAHEELQHPKTPAMCRLRNGRLSSRLLRSSSRLLPLSYPSTRAR